MSKLIIVINAESCGQVFQAMEAAFDNGADGVFLVNQGVSARKLQDVYGQVRSMVGPNVFVGLNFSDLQPLQALKAIEGCWDASALWLENTGYVQGYRPHLDQVTVPGTIARTLKACRYPGQIFGGIGRKGEHPAEDVFRAVKTVAQFVDVVTIRGLMDRMPPFPQQVREIKAEAPKTSLAITNGITSDTVGSYLNDVDYFLVPARLNDSTVVDPHEVKALTNKMRQREPPS